MFNTREAVKNIHWVGGSDRRLALFENLFPVPRGVSYNSFLILDEKTALIDTVDSSIRQQFTDNVKGVLAGRKLDYLVINHMEPDHCASIEDIVLRYPEVKIVGNAKTFQFIRQFYDFDLEGRTVEVKEGDTLPLGEHTLQFVFAPMVHWPEVMMTYEQKEKILFSADAFGTFGALNGNLFADEVRYEREWLDDARRYYSNIVGKYGAQVQAVLKKAAGLEISMICPLHGPIWRRDLDWLLGKYDLWSRYVPEEKAVAIFYGSMYGNTENAAELLASRLSQAGVQNVAMYDVSSTHVSYLISEIFRCSTIVFACPTYNMGIYPAMHNLLHDMKALGLGCRTAAVLENGSWACASGKLIRQQLAEMKNMTVLEPGLKLASSLKDCQVPELDAMVQAVAQSLQ